MNAVAHFLNVATFIALIIGWVVFVWIFTARKKTSKGAEIKRGPTPSFGLVAQPVSYALVWLVQRPLFSPILPLGPLFDIVMATATIALLAGSLWIMKAAADALGKQWSIKARLIEGHALITEGPYRIARHPIYTGMFGLLLATGLVMTYWFILPVAIIFHLIGANMRARSEEKLLRDEFGEVYENYARKAPALIPQLRQKR
jgi:protein-S-isoprenylcysteine O-methyltransferase Ste14